MPRYSRPTAKSDALAALAEADGTGRALVGGTDLLVGLRHHTIEPSVLVDLKAVADFPPPIAVDDDAVRIGPTLTLAQLVAHPVVRRSYPALVQAAVTVGSVAIRNRASLVGNACNASPAADTVPALLVLDAIVTIESVAGERDVPLDDFLLGPRETRCGRDELVTRLTLPRPADGSRSAFRRLTRRLGVDLATVSAAAAVSPGGAVVLGLGAVGPRAVRTELALADASDADAVEAALAHRLPDVTSPIGDVRGSRAYRVAMVRVLARRAVLAAAEASA